MSTATYDPVTQRSEALARANEVRLARVNLRQQIRAGQLSPLDVLNNIPLECLNMTVYSLLSAQWRWGDRKTRGVLGRCLMSQTRTLGQLTDRQRSLLRAELR